MKSILKYLASSLIKTAVEFALEEFKNLLINKISENHSIDGQTKEKFVAAIHSIDLKDFIKNC